MLDGEFGHVTVPDFNSLVLMRGVKADGGKQSVNFLVFGRVFHFSFYLMKEGGRASELSSARSACFAKIIKIKKSGKIAFRPLYIGMKERKESKQTSNERNKLCG